MKGILEGWRSFLSEDSNEIEGIKEVALSLRIEFVEQIKLAKGMIKDEIEEKAKEHFSQFRGMKMKFITGGAGGPTVEGVFTGNIKFEVQNRGSEAYVPYEQVIFEIEREGHLNWVRVRELR